MSDPRGRMTTDSDGELLKLSGAIDETARLLELIDRARGNKLVLDLAGITFINSLGVRDWIRLQQAAQQANVRVELRRVAEPIIHQLNIVVATRGNSIVSSFFAPYACDDCGREESMLIDVTVHGISLARQQPPPMKCHECGADMVFNDFPELYFSFLSAEG